MWFETKSARIIIIVWIIVEGLLLILKAIMTMYFVEKRALDDEYANSLVNYTNNRSLKCMKEMRPQKKKPEFSSHLMVCPDS